MADNVPADTADEASETRERAPSRFRLACCCSGVVGWCLPADRTGDALRTESWLPEAASPRMNEAGDVGAERRTLWPSGDSGVRGVGGARSTARAA